MSVVGRVRAGLRGALGGGVATADSPVDPLTRRNERSELQPLAPAYFERQLTLMREVSAALRRNPAVKLEELLARPELSEIGERVVEYGWIARALLQRFDAGRRTRLM